MRFLPAFKYRFRDCMFSMGVVILVMIVLTALCYLGIVTFGSITRTDNSGEVIMHNTAMNFSMPVAIFMFVLSIVSIREDMRLGIQNGAGRGTVFLANTACMLVTALILNIAFFVVTAVWNQFDTGVYIVDFFGALYTGEPFFASFAARLARQVPVPVILTGGNRRFDVMERLAREDGIAAFGLCRPLVCEPDLVNRWQKDPHAAPRCLSCNGCNSTPGHRCILPPRR